MNSEMKKGKFNIVDLIVLLLIVIGAAFVVVKLLQVGKQEEALQKIQITFMEEECPDFVVDYTKIGDTLYDPVEEVFLGKVTDVQTGEAMLYTYDEETGYSYAGGKDNYCSVYITGEAEGQMTEGGAIIGDMLYTPGMKMTLRAGTGKYYLFVYDVRALD